MLVSALVRVCMQQPLHYNICCAHKEASERGAKRLGAAACHLPPLTTNTHTAPSCRSHCCGLAV